MDVEHGYIIHLGLKERHGSVFAYVLVMYMDILLDWTLAEIVLVRLY